MSDTIIAAIIGGCFALFAALVSNYLKPKSGAQASRKRTSPREKHEPALTDSTYVEVSHIEPDVVQRGASEKKRRLGELLVFGSLIVAVFVISAFDLDEREPEWEGIFSTIWVTVFFIGVYLWFANRKKVQKQ